eukprot:2303083-Rhodomonas_salina.1
MDHAILLLHTHTTRARTRTTRHALDFDNPIDKKQKQFDNQIDKNKNKNKQTTEWQKRSARQGSAPDLADALALLGGGLPLGPARAHVPLVLLLQPTPVPHPLFAAREPGGGGGARRRSEEEERGGGARRRRGSLL